MLSVCCFLTLYCSSRCSGTKTRMASTGQRSETEWVWSPVTWSLRSKQRMTKWWTSSSNRASCHSTLLWRSWVRYHFPTGTISASIVFFFFLLCLLPSVSIWSSQCSTELSFTDFPLLSPRNYVFLLSCKVNCDRFQDGRSINRRSRKSKRGLCPLLLPAWSLLLFILLLSILIHLNCF